MNDETFKTKVLLALQRLETVQDQIEHDISDIKAGQKRFVTRDEFLLVRNLVLGAVGIMVAAVLTALVSQVVP